MKQQNEATIPKVDEFAQLKAIASQVKAIIEKIDFINDEKDLIKELCNDALFFLEFQKPKLFIMHVSHTFREITEKFFGKAKSVDKDDFFVFKDDVPDELIKELDKNDIYGFIDKREDRTIKLKRLINIKERDLMLRMSTEEAWHEDVWELNDRYANNNNSKRDLGTKQFFKAIPAKYSVSSWSYDELVKTRKALYEKLSTYVHGGDLQEIVAILEKESEDRSESENKIIDEYLEVNMSIIDIFRPFEATTNDKVKQIDDLLNE